MVALSHFWYVSIFCFRESFQSLTLATACAYKYSQNYIFGVAKMDEMSLCNEHGLVGKRISFCLIIMCVLCACVCAGEISVCFIISFFDNDQKSTIKMKQMPRCMMRMNTHPLCMFFLSFFGFWCRESCSIFFFQLSQMWYVSLYSIDVQTFVKCLRCSHNEWTEMIHANKSIKASLNHTLFPAKGEKSHKTLLLHLARISCLFNFCTCGFGGPMNFTLFKQQQQQQMRIETERHGDSSKNVSICLTTYSTANSVNKHRYCAACCHWWWWWWWSCIDFHYCYCLLLSVAATAAATEISLSLAFSFIHIEHDDASQEGKGEKARLRTVKKRKIHTIAWCQVNVRPKTMAYCQNSY